MLSSRRSDHAKLSQRAAATDGSLPSPLRRRGALMMLITLRGDSNNAFIDYAHGRATLIRLS